MTFSVYLRLCILSGTGTLWVFPSYLTADPRVTNNSGETIAVLVCVSCFSTADDLICSMSQSIKVEAGKSITPASCMASLPTGAIAEVKNYKITVYANRLEDE